MYIICRVSTYIIEDLRMERGFSPTWEPRIMPLCIQLPIRSILSTRSVELDYALHIYTHAYVCTHIYGCYTNMHKHTDDMYIRTHIYTHAQTHVYAYKYTIDIHPSLHTCIQS